MRRRALLSTLATSTAALAGCVVPSPDDRTPAPSGVTPFVHEVAVVSETPSAAAPPAIAVSVRNADDESHLLATSNYAFPFPTSLGGQTDGGGALVVATEAPDGRDGCWTGILRQRPMVARRPFGPGEDARRRYVVLNHDENATCWPPGEYRFTQPYYLDPPADGPVTDGTRYAWGFTLRIREAGGVSVAGTHGPTRTE